MTDRDFYQVLGVSRSASTGEIRAAYLRLVKRHHPDAADHLPGRLGDVQQAYRCLSNAEARARHDAGIAQSERLYRARQRSVQRRLTRYDSRHPHAAPRPRRRRWRSLALAAAGLALAARLSLAYFG